MRINCYILLLFISILFIASNTQAQRAIKHNTEEEMMGYWPPQYLIADSVSLRSDSSINGKLLLVLPIGTSVRVLKASTKMQTIKGITSPWYKVRTDSLTGWVWGALLLR